MIPKNTPFRLTGKIFDFIILNLTFVAAASYAQSFQLLLERSHMFVLLAILNAVWHIGAAKNKLSENLTNDIFINFTWNLFKICAALSIVSIFFIFFVKEPLFTRNFIFYHTILFFILSLSRNFIFKKIIISLRKKGRGVRYVLLAGYNETGKVIYDALKNESLGFKIIGYVNDFPSDSNYLGPLNKLEEIVLEKQVDDVIIALPLYESQKLDKIIKLCNRHAIRTHIVPDYAKFISHKFNFFILNNIPIITIRSEPLSEIQNRLVKRTFDLIFSSAVIIFLLSWLIPIIAVIQKLTSKGPIFFKQERVGMNNILFKCYKFRSMTDEASKRKGFKAVSSNDSRLTKFGAFMRKSNIDELPQFFNVFLGNMSIVGPRPSALIFNEVYKQYINEFKLRNLVKPGITGWAQIHGLRGDSKDEDENKLWIKKRFDYDLWYVENWSFWLDMQIIFLTVIQIINGKAKGI